MLKSLNLIQSLLSKPPDLSGGFLFVIEEGNELIICLDV